MQKDNNEIEDYLFVPLIDQNFNIDGTRILYKLAENKPLVLDLRNFRDEDLIKKDSFLTKYGYKRYFKSNSRELEFVLAESHICERIIKQKKFFSDFEKYELLRF